MTQIPPRVAARFFAPVLLGLCLAATDFAPARAADPGVTPTSVTIGQTVPLSGPVSAYATFSRASLAFYDMINAEGGIAGRKVNLISVDDSYSPPKTVEQTRKLVESDEVFAIVAPVGGSTSKSVQKYLERQGPAIPDPVYPTVLERSKGISLVDLRSARHRHRGFALCALD